MQNNGDIEGLTEISCIAGCICRNDVIVLLMLEIFKDESASEVEDQTNVKSSEDPTDLELEVMEQGRLIIQLKEMIRERDETLNNKDTEIKVSCLYLK